MTDEVKILRMHALDTPIERGSRTIVADFDALIRGIMFKGCRLMRNDARGWYATAPARGDARHSAIRFIDLELWRSVSAAALAHYRTIPNAQGEDSDDAGLLRVLGVDPAISETLDRAGL